MAVEIGRFIKDQLERLPPGHPDRGYLQGLLATTKSYIKRGDRGVAVDILNPSQLVEEEHEALREFFGREVLVVAPPSEFLETQEVAKAEGFGRILKPIYFPAVEFSQDDKYPGWKVKPEERYWKQIRAGSISNDAAKLGGHWGLFDESRRPNYNGGRQMFPEDPLAPILSQARKEGRITVPDSVKNVPEGSRFAVSPNEQDQTVFPQLAKILRLTEGAARVRRPTVMEFNFAGNLRYPHLGEANTWEWLYDNFEGGDQLIGGHLGSGGFAHVYGILSAYHYDDVAFRPLVVFSPKT